MDKQQSSVKTGGLLLLEDLSIDRTTYKNRSSILSRLAALFFVSTHLEKIHCKGFSICNMHILFCV